MFGLCGWIGPAGAAPGSEGAVLDAMAKGLRSAPHASADAGFRRSTPVAALALATPAPGGDSADGGTHWAVIEGEPRWLDPELAGQAATKGHAAALVEAYRRFGAGLLDRLRGHFALAVVDPAAARALIAVDRFGVFGLCYAEPAPGALVFGTTTDAVRAHQGVAARVGPQQIHDYLFASVMPAPGTIFDSLRKLRPGECAIVEDGAVHVRSYYDIPYAESTDDERTLGEATRAEVELAMRRTLETCGDALVGAFLSGGLDSSTLAGYLAKLRPGPSPTFTIGFDVDGFDEMEYARIAARHFGTEHHEHYLKPAEVLDAMPRLAAAYDEPFGNSSAVPAYLCAKLAHDRGVAVMIAGDGGDEIFAGNKRYVEQRRFAGYARLPRLLRSGLIEPVANILPLDGPWLFRKARRYVDQARVPLPDRLEIDNPLIGAALGSMFTDAALGAIDPTATMAERRAVFARARTAAELKRMLYLDLQITLADNDIRKVRRTCELAGVAVRFPFLDDEVVELAAQIPADLLLKAGELRGFYKAAFRGFLAEPTIAKKKHGFGMPFAEWLGRDPGLKALARDCLAGFGSRGFLRRSFLDALAASLGRDDGNSHAGGIAWDITVLELWLRARRIG